VGSRAVASRTTIRAQISRRPSDGGFAVSLDTVAYFYTYLGCTPLCLGDGVSRLSTLSGVPCTAVMKLERLRSRPALNPPASVGIAAN